MAAVPPVDAQQMHANRTFAALYAGVVKRTAQHLGAHRPRAGCAHLQGQVDPGGLHRFRHERHDPGVVRAGQDKLEFGHGETCRWKSVIRDAAASRTRRASDASGTEAVMMMDDAGTAQLSR